MKDYRQKSANINFRDELAAIINRELDLEGVLVTVTRVDVAPDFLNIRVYISTLPEKEAGKALVGLRGIVREIGEQLAAKIRIKYIPKINFFKDEGASNYAEVEKIIQELHETKRVPKKTGKTGGFNRG